MALRQPLRGRMAQQQTYRLGEILPMPAVAMMRVSGGMARLIRLSEQLARQRELEREREEEEWASGRRADGCRAAAQERGNVECHRANAGNDTTEQRRRREQLHKSRIQVGKKLRLTDLGGVQLASLPAPA